MLSSTMRFRSERDGYARYSPSVVIVALWVANLPGAIETARAEPESAHETTSTANHREFEELQGSFESGPQVTQACLECHTEAAKQVQDTVHWTWSFEHPDTGQQLGKRHVVNSFCSNVRANEPRCTSCHNGYGWDDASFDFADETLVDCLSCHDTTGTYTKAPKRAGRVLEEKVRVHGKTLKPPNLGHVARNVGAPSIETCGSCHFNGGGGDGSKHGDLDSSLLDAPYELSVHMSPEGAGMGCSDCHVTRGHDMAGGRYDMTARDQIGTGHPGHRRAAATCESCHGLQPHDGSFYIATTLNQHSDRVACQTCHIPKIARGGVSTKTFWDWSKAGRLDEGGRPIHEKNENGRTTYWSRWGEIRWDENYRPSYAWFDGDVRYTLPTDRIDPNEVVPINFFSGDHDDPDARIWPFKIMRGRQPYDAERQRLAMMHLFGDGGTAYWKNLEWKPAIEAAMEAADLPFSGKVGFVDTKMYWAVTHMVAPADQALSCKSCHSKSSVLSELGGFYMPARDAHGLIDLIGRLALAAVALAVLVHGGLRIRYHLGRRRR